MENNQPEPTEHNFLDEPEAYQQYVCATSGQRFLNFLIDNLLMRYVLSYATGYAIGYFLGSFFPGFLSSLASNDTMGIFLLSYIIGIFNYIIYYTLCEKLFKGHTLGKAITGTRAIREDHSELTFKDAILRSLSRLVPFEPFSGFKEHPWHDTWTKTMVIKTR